jgi:hypothetical protein
VLPRYDGAVLRYFSPRCIGMHVTLVVVLPLFAWLTWWQLNRAQSGNTLSWAYVALWPAFGIYAVYTWWQLIHDQAARLPEGDGTGGPDLAMSASPDPAIRPPGWALTGGRRKNIAIAAATPIDVDLGGRGERFTAQTPEEAARLVEYNRYLAELSDEDRASTTTGPDAGATS